MDDFENGAFRNVLSSLGCQNPNTFVLVFQIENLLKMILNFFKVLVNKRHGLMKMLYDDFSFLQSLLIGKMIDEMKKCILFIAVNDGVLGFGE